MIGEPWLYLSVLMLGVFDLLALWYVIRVADSVQSMAAAMRDEPNDGGRIECPQCGTENESGYRFCRHCVGELPGAGGRQPVARTAGSGSLR